MFDLCMLKYKAVLIIRNSPMRMRIFFHISIRNIELLFRDE